MVQQLDNEAEFNAALEAAGDKAVFVDFTATWCGPCKQIGPVFESLAKQNQDAVFVKVDVDVNKATAARYGVQAMPTFIAIKKKKKVGEVVGADSSKLAQLIDDHKYEFSTLASIGGAVVLVAAVAGIWMLTQQPSTQHGKL